MNEHPPDVTVVAAAPSTVKHREVAPVALDYVTALESTAIVDVADRYELFIDGRFVEPRSGKHVAYAANA